MPISGAERQAAYRARHLDPTKPGGKTAGRINMLVSLEAVTDLDLLSACYGVTKRELIEALLASAMREAENLARKETGSASALYHRKLRLDRERLVGNRTPRR